VSAAAAIFGKHEKGALITPILTLAIGLLVGGLIVSVMGALLSINELAIN
jgi:general secretion pathway protein F